MKKVLFYITGHGFGHAIPVIEVIKQLRKLNPDLMPVLNTAAPDTFFKRCLEGEYKYIRCKNDVGAIQKDWRYVDKLKTLERYANLIKQEPDLINEQMSFIRQNRIKAVISDIPAIAFVIAKEAGIPSFGISNFSWDWIYSPYVEEYPAFKYVVDHIRECYSKAGQLLRLPFHGDLSAFPVIHDIPLISQRAKLSREETIKRLNLNPAIKIVLVYLGNFDFRRVLTREILNNKNFTLVSFDILNGSNDMAPDLLNAADIVVTKPGIGIVSDAIAARTPVLYTSREDFQEYHVLVKGLKKYAHCRLLPLEDLLAGNWLEHLNALLSSEHNWPKIDVNGAEIAARKISEVL
ncbi:MAG: hypothetical protein ABIA63_15245 [bacterium]